MLEIGSSEYLTSPHFDARERAAVLWAEHVAKNTAGVRDDVFAEVKREFSDQEIVELTGVCGLFAQSNRFQDSMCLPIEEQGEVDKIRQSVRADPVRLKAYLDGMVKHWPGTFPPAAAVVGVSGRPVAPAARSPFGAPRVPLLDPADAAPDARHFMEAARELCGGISSFVRVWAHVPNIGKLSLPFLTAFERDGLGSTLPAALRLIVMLKMHHVHSAAYLLAHHTLLAKAAGVHEAQLAALASEEGESSPHFSERERAAIAWAGEVARNTAKRNEPAYAALKRQFSDAEVVELTALCAVTSNADLFCNALRVPIEPAAELQALTSGLWIDPARLKAYVHALVADWPTSFPVPEEGQRSTGVAHRA